MQKMVRIEDKDALDNVLTTIGAVMSFALFLALLSYGWFRVFTGL